MSLSNEKRHDNLVLYIAAALLAFVTLAARADTTDAKSITEAGSPASAASTTDAATSANVTSTIDATTVSDSPQQAATTTEAAPAPPAKPDPFAFADFTWLNGNSRQHTPVFDTKALTGEIRVDTKYVYDFNHPRGHTL